MFIFALLLVVNFTACDDDDDDDQSRPSTDDDTSDDDDDDDIIPPDDDDDTTDDDTTDDDTTDDDTTDDDTTDDDTTDDDTTDDDTTDDDTTDDDTTDDDTTDDDTTDDDTVDDDTVDDDTTDDDTTDDDTTDDDTTDDDTVDDDTADDDTVDDDTADDDTADDDTADDDIAFDDTVEITAGNFYMGCEPNDTLCYDDELPRHQVTLSAYLIDVYEVTNERFAEFLNANGNDCDGHDCADTDNSRFQIHQVGEGWVADTGDEYRPVMLVSWYGAVAFCEWTGGRLPTEAEWEKAAKGAAEHYIYPWSDTWMIHAANWGENNDPYQSGDWPYTCPVGYYDGTNQGGVYQTVDGSSPYGLYDMAGNVEEWVNDWYNSDYYATSPSTDPPGPAGGDRRGTRGGSWSTNYGDDILRTSIRWRYYPTDMEDNLGFRCVQDVL
ncbi:MAG TPA: SUMF1/EgtB/PvdO family nonheme iron enzyme [bacterium]|nr:SUMF1/EgtB/PvdO family nonheme iron enzyme [bacterium]